MSKVILWHNPRCSKSRATKQILEERGVELDVIEYLTETPSLNQIADVLDYLGLQPRQLMRTGESAYSDNNLDNEQLSREQLIQAMIDHPILVERPIVIANGKAAIGRPPESVLEIL